MNSFQKILVLALACAASTLSAETFVRPMAYFVDPTTKGYSSAGAFGVQAGYSFGAKQQHEIGGEFLFMRWEEDVRSYYYSYEGSENYMPYLASYRYKFGQSDSKVRGYVGPSIGFMSSYVELEGHGGTYEDSDVTFAGGASAGLLIKLANRVDLDVTYKYLHAEGGEYTAFGRRVRGDAMKFHMIGVGVNIRF